MAWMPLQVCTIYASVFCIVFSFLPGNLLFANIVPDDAKRGRQYVCSAQSLVMRKIERGAFAVISPQGRQYSFICSVLSHSLSACLHVLRDSKLWYFLLKAPLETWVRIIRLWFLWSLFVSYYDSLFVVICCQQSIQGS